MARTDLNLGDIEVDPEVRNRYELAMQRTPPPPVAPPPVHPVVAMATKMLSPLGSVGPMGPAAPPYPDYPTEHLNRTPAEQDALLAGNRSSGEAAWQAFVNRTHSSAVGPMGMIAPLSRTSFGNQERADMAQRPSYNGPSMIGAPRTGAVPADQRGAMPRGDNPLEFLTGPDMPWNQPLDPGASAHVLDQVPVIGGLQNLLGSQFRSAPLGENGAIRAFSDYRAARKQYGPNSPEANAALENWGASAVNVAAGISAGSGRFKAETGVSRSLVRDTATGKAEPTIYTGKAHVADAEAAAAKLNAQTGTAPGAGIAVPQEAGIKAAVDHITNVKTASGDTIGRVIRVGAREQGLTVDHMLNTPEFTAQVMNALRVAKLPASDANMAAVAEQLFTQETARPTVGNRNYAAVKDALGGNDAIAAAFADTTATGGKYPGLGEKIPPVINVPASAEQVAASAGTKTAAQAEFNRLQERDIAAGPKLVGTSPNATPLSQPPARFNAGAYAATAADEVNSLLRASLAGGDISTVGLQGAPLFLKDFAKALVDPAGWAAFLKNDGGAFSNRPAPYWHTALGSLAKALVAGDSAGRVGIYGHELPFSAPTKMQEITAGFTDALAKKGINPKDIGISDPNGPMLAREEFAAGKILTNLPVVGLVFRQSNQAAVTFLNALRTGEALQLERAYADMKMPFPKERVGNLIKVATGRADLPGVADGGKMARALQWVFFGPKLAASTIKTIPDTIGAVLHSGENVLQRRPLDPVDISRIQTTVTFVATGWGAMKIAEASGLAIGTDPEKTDFGRITLPGGHRLDLWGPFNEEARTIAREIAFVSNTVQGKKPVFGAKTGLDVAGDYLRSKLGPIASAGASVLAGKNMAGQTPAEVLQSTITNPNPIAGFGNQSGTANPMSMVPTPFSVQGASQAFDPAQGGQGGIQGVAETAAGVLGFSVLPARINIPKDGLGRPEGSPSFGKDEIITEYEALFPGKTLTAPDSTIGSGKSKLQLPSTQADAYIQAVGEERRIELGNLIYSPAYQAMTQDQKAKAYEAAKTKADNTATREYLAHDVIKATDPKLITAEAVSGFEAQGGSNKNEAYWVALLDRAGKLTPEVAKAIDESQVTMPGQRAPITVEEMRNDAPLVHEYLAHVPYGSDKNPIGTPADWVAVEQAKQQQSVLKDQMIRSGVNPSLAEAQAKQQTLQTMRSMVQRTLFLNGASLVNQQRKTLATKYGTRLTRYLGGNDVPYTQESETEYQNFPFGR